MKHARSNWFRISRTMVIALTGGTVMGACDTRLRDAIVTGSKDYLFTILNPTNIISLFVPEDATETEDG